MEDPLSRFKKALEAHRDEFENDTAKLLHASCEAQAITEPSTKCSIQKQPLFLAEQEVQQRDDQALPKEPSYNSKHYQSHQHHIPESKLSQLLAGFGLLLQMPKKSF